ncbi:MAG: tetratricopeptide repeat protein [Pedosphaera sp.]|nr:tetratricopeptide repeat protein [Pedosphaera sp.]
MSRTPKPRSGLIIVLGIAGFITLVALVAGWFHRHSNEDSQFTAHLTAGRLYHDAGDYFQSISSFQSALAMNPVNPDIHINLANLFLRANQPAQTQIHAAAVLQIEPRNAAALYLAGCASLRLGAFSNAVQSLTEATHVDESQNQLRFQLGLAYAGWGHFQEAAKQFIEVLKFDNKHPTARYHLGQTYLQLKSSAEASVELAAYQEANQGRFQVTNNPSDLEKCQYTEIITASTLEQPDKNSISVRFEDQTARAFGTNAAALRGPFGLFDLNHRGWNDLLVTDISRTLQLLWNSNSVFVAHSTPLASTVGLVNEIAVGDLNNDGYDDALLVGTAGSQLLSFATNGFITDTSALAGIRTVKGMKVVVADPDFTDKFSLFFVSSEGRLRTFSPGQTELFREHRSTPGDGFGVSSITSITVDDWNNDGLPDLLFTRRSEPPWILTNRRGEGLGATIPLPDWPIASSLCVGDFNNDLRSDVVLVTPDTLTIQFGGLRDPRRIPARKNGIAQLKALDYDNDGWLDLVGWGSDGLRIWRNRGRRGFHEMTRELGLSSFSKTHIIHAAFADFDQDGDIDVVISVDEEGLRLLRNDGANTNGLVKLRPIGTKSNSSGIGLRLDLKSDHWRALRTAQSKPIEIGVGKHRSTQTLLAYWPHTHPLLEITADPKQVIDIIEPKAPNASSPHLFAWDGNQFRFVTDLLGSVPLDSPSGIGQLIERNPHEWTSLGRSKDLVPREGRYSFQITEELREVLYLDEVKLGWVDTLSENEVHVTRQQVPNRPFPPPPLRILGERIPLLQAWDSNGQNIALKLGETDNLRHSSKRPLSQIGVPTEVETVVMDFGLLPADSDLTLALTGRSSFGDGMANHSGSGHPKLLSKSLSLEAELAEGTWQKLPIKMGVPLDKPETFLISLKGFTPRGTRRLRLNSPLEIQWDRFALFRENLSAKTGEIHPLISDLHWRGFSDFAQRSRYEPASPLYRKAHNQPPWCKTPSGWATRYGAVGDLISGADSGLVVITGGDELTLEFDALSLPPIPSGTDRHFFLWTVGWRKTDEYRVATGGSLEPLPWAGADNLNYGKKQRPSFDSDAMNFRFNSRWIGPITYGHRSNKRR